MTASPPDLKIQSMVSQDVATMVGGSSAEALQKAERALASEGYTTQTNPETMTVEGSRTRPLSAMETVEKNPFVPLALMGVARHLTPGVSQRATVALQPVKDGHWATVTVDTGNVEGQMEAHPMSERFGLGPPQTAKERSRAQKETANIVGRLQTDPQKAPPGWYPVENRPGTQGYWDGTKYLKFAPLDEG